MKKSLVLKVLLVAIAICVALGLSPQTSFAQRGGRGGGGMGFRGGNGAGFRGGTVAGFHSSGANHGYATGRPYGSTPHAGAHFNASGYHRVYHAGYGWHSGHYGWHGGYRWYPYWYPFYGWSWNVGWPYWGWGYGYYGYNPWYYGPYPYYPQPDDCPPGYSCPPNGNDDPPPAGSAPKPGHTPAKPWRPHQSAPGTDEGSDYRAARFDAPVLTTERETISAGNYPVKYSTAQRFTQIRPEVQTAMRALREMPPFVRQREIETGRYSHFTDEERALLRNMK